MSAQIESVDKFIYDHLNLLEMEKQEEVLQNRLYGEKLSLTELQTRGVCLIKLRIVSLRTGLYGRHVITFGPKWAANQLPSHGITSGDIVGVTLNSESVALVSGVVVKLTQTSIDVAFDDMSALNEFNHFEQVFNLIKLTNDVTYRRLKLALNNLKKCLSNNLVQVLFGETPVSAPNESRIVGLNKFFNGDLNASQKDAIEFAMNQKEVAIIHGPPGTGKTTTLIEFVLQCVRNDQLKVLACAPSNVAVDNLLEKLAVAKQDNMVRLGHPARAFAELQKYTLDAAIARSDHYEVVRDMRSEMESLIKSRSYSQIRGLRKELKAQEKKALKQVLSSSKIVLSTLTSASPEGPLKQLIQNDDYLFDVVVIDECSQSLEAAAWIVLNYAPKCVLAGDHMQLPPTIISEKAAKQGLEISLMERLIKSLNNSAVVRMLNVQYRMNESIMKWSSKQFYSDKLVAFDSNKNHTLNDISNDCNISPLILIDTAGCDMNELDLEDEESKGNEYEADIVAVYAQQLLKKGFSQTSIGIISPYNLQVELIRARLKAYQNIEIKSVDGFQGREKEIIILSMVRSNERNEVGFLSERRRINVAITRAKRHLVVVCDSDTISNDSVMNSLIEHFHNCGEIISAHEFAGDIEKLDVQRPSNLRFKAIDLSKPKSQKQNKENKIKNVKHHKYNDEKKIEEQKNIYLQKLNEFISDEKSKELCFPPSLTSFERMLVHEIAESLHLIHESVGEETERHIVLKKKCVNDTNPIELKLLDNKNEENVEIVEENVSTNEIPTVTDENHMTQVLRKNVKSVKPKNKQKKEVIVKTIKKSQPKNTTNLKKTLTLPDTEDIDQLIASVKRSDNTCSYGKCKISISVLGQCCRFCSHRFCLSHSMPEIHGCGEQVRAYVKSTIRKDGKLYAGTGIPTKSKSNPITRNYLEKKLNNKLSEMSSERKAKNQSKEK